MLDRIENKLIDKLDSIDLMSIVDLFDCKYNDVDDIINNYFAKRTSFKGEVNLTGISNVKNLGKLKRIDGNLTAHYSGLEDLSNLKVVNGDVSIRYSPLESTGKLIYCNSLYVNGSHFKEIKKLTEVNKDVTLLFTSIETLNKLELIGGSLNLSNNKELASTGNVRGIYGTLTISSCPKLTTLGSIEHISGCLDVRNAALQSFGSLIRLDGFAIALKSKVKNLYESDLKILDLSPLTSIFTTMPKAMHLQVPRIDNLKDFGMIVIDDGLDNDNIFSI